MSTSDSKIEFKNNNQPTDILLTTTASLDMKVLLKVNMKHMPPNTETVDQINRPHVIDLQLHWEFGLLQSLFDQILCAQPIQNNSDCYIEFGFAC